jgi:hypothetical protein
MDKFTKGMLWFVISLLLSGISSFFGRFAILGSLTNSGRGFLDGLCVVACGVSIGLLVRSRRRA